MMNDAEREALFGRELSKARDPRSRQMIELVRSFASAVVELRREIAEVREKSLRYRGVWQAADEYRRGDAVTRTGSFWICNSTTPTTEAPGTGSSWQLAHKSGEPRR